MPPSHASPATVPPFSIGPVIVATSVDARGDLWIARADGSRSERLMKGSFTLPAWSEDGRILAVAERKDGGRRWDISVIHLPEQYRR